MKKQNHVSRTLLLTVVLLASFPNIYSQTTWYSYQSGAWNNPNVWTVSPGGTTLVNPSNSIPGNGDAVVILPSRTITLRNGNVVSTGLDITIQAAGVLDDSLYTFPSGLAALRGRGTLKLKSTSFPAATLNTLIQQGGGTVEYYNSENFTLPPAQTSYNNLTINCPGFIATQAGDITLYGNLVIQGGTYRINDGTAARRSLVINGDFTVFSGAVMNVSTGQTNTTTDPASAGTGGSAPFLDYYIAQSHRIEINGNFLNNGTVRFTNQSFPDFNNFPVNGFASVFFMGAGDKTLTCNGITDFYNLIVDKGTDQTYTLTVNSSGYDKFRIFGANNASEFTGSDGNNPNIRKALWIRSGTLRLRGYVFIPSLVEGSASGSGDYFIPGNGALMMDGPDVVVMGTIDDYRVVNLAYGVAAPDNSTIGITTVPSVVPSGFSIYGKLQVNDGSLYVGEIGRLIAFGSGAQLIINGGTIDAKQFQSAGTGKAAYWQAGGSLILRGRFQRSLDYGSLSALISSVGDVSKLNTQRAYYGTSTPLGTEPGVGTLSIYQDANAFHMEGGTIRIYDPSGASSPSMAIQINADPANIDVSGGSIELYLTAGTGNVSGGVADASYGIASKAPVFNLSITRNSGSQSAVLIPIPGNPPAGVTPVTSPPLVVLNNLTLTEPFANASAVLNASGFDVKVGGNFVINSNAEYTPGTNRTILNGTGSQAFSNNGTITSGLYKLLIDKSSGTATMGSNFAVRDSLGIFGGTLADGGYTLSVAGNIYNAGTHSGNGKIVLNGTAAQNISASFSGNPSLGNIEVTNATGASGNTVITLGSDLTVYSLMLTSDRVFNIGSYRLTVGLGGIPASLTYSVSRMIRCNGQPSDGGLRRQIDNRFNGQAVLFPVGSPGGPRNTATAYFPGRMYPGNVTTPGYFTVVPVANYHPSCQVSRQNDALDFYWKTKSSDLVTAGTRHLEFVYRINIPNSYNDPYYLIGSVWGTGAGNNNSPVLIFPESIGNPAGDFTAGKNSPFRNPTTYYSRTSGAWNASTGVYYTTWSLTGHNGSAVPVGTGLPQNYDNVIIGGVAGVRNDSVTVTANGITAAIITINGSYTNDEHMPVLNIQSTTGHTIDIIRGNGKFCTSTTSIPASPTDYGEFTNNTSAVFNFYGASYTLPASITTYPNLQINGGNTKSLNTSGAVVLGNLIIADHAAANNALSLNSASGNLTVNGDLLFSNGGKLIVPVSSTSRNINIYGDIDFRYGNTNNINAIEVTNGAGTVHKLNFYGDTIFSGASNLTFNRALANKIDLYVMNSGRTVVTNGTGSFNLNRLFIIKEAVTDTVYFKNNFTLNESNNSTINKSLILTTGLLVISDAGNSIPSTTNLNLSSGGTNYYSINSYSGLILRNGAKINISGNTDGSGLRLDGLLQAEGNSEINFADGTSGNTGYIEYTSSGNAVLNLSGSSLLKVSQIRRSLLLSTGIISYTQSGSSAATIYGVGASTARARFEVTGTGSSFSMSGTSVLSIINGGGGTTYGDLYLRPSVSSVTGGDIVFGTGVNGQTYRADASVYLNNLILNTTGPANTLYLMINPLRLNGNLQISNTNSILTASNIDVTIKGNFTNNGTYNPGTNTTTFSGLVQTLGGTSVTNFNNLTVSPATSLTLSRNVIITNNLSVTSGTLISSSFDIEVRGNVTNNGIITSDPAPAANRLYLHGNTLQYLGGTGSFASIELDNPSGARLQNDISLTRDMVMTSGNLYISQYLLILGTGSNIAGSGFGINKMIMPDGVFSNIGIRKSFAAGYSGTFVYPIGVAGKYTPAVLQVTSTNAGFVRINTINDIHPSALTPFNALNYYWEAESSVTGFRGSLTLNYSAADVAGTESDYVAARLIIPPGTYWNKAAPGATTDNVNEFSHKITFDFPSTTNNLGGHYTAGEDSSIPNLIQVYTSNVVTGNWETPSSWTPEAPEGGPAGSIVVIQPGHTISTGTNRRFSYNITINGTLDVGTTFDHNLGNVSGTGRLKINGPVIPAGRFDSFFSCDGGTLEFSGNTNYTIIADRLDTLRNLLFTGTGIRVLPDKDLVICGQLEINGPVLDNTVNNRQLSIGGTFMLTAGTFLSGSGANAIVSFTGDSPQTIAGFNSSTGSPLNNLKINNSNGLTLNSNIDINGDLLLANGIITTSGSNILKMNNPSGNASTIPLGGSASSYVNGPLSVYLFGGSNFIFPEGKATRYGKVQILNARNGIWQAEYFNSAFSNTSVTGTLTSVSNSEYWKIISPANGSTAKVQLRWDSQSDISPLNTANGMNDIRVAEFNGASWIEKASDMPSGDNNNGTVQTTSNIIVNNSIHPQFYTLGSVSIVKPTIFLGPGPQVLSCETNAQLPYTLTTGNPDQYILLYDATAQAAGFVNILSWTALPASPVLLTVPGTAASGVYNGSIQVRSTSSPSNVSNPVSFTVTIIPGRTWRGITNSDWNTPSNWSCGTVPDQASEVIIPNVPNKPVLSSGVSGAVNNLTISSGSSLVISGNTLRISGILTNNGTFDAAGGTIEMNGISAQVIGASVFTGNTVGSLTVSNASGVTLQGPLNVTGIVRVVNGNLSSAGYLTLVSSSSGTSLIDGSGNGTVSGNVTMQRYLPSGFGYKYFSSPFQNATVGEFDDDRIIDPWYATVYRYDENNTISGMPASGWVEYETSANSLSPLAGYAVNFGDLPAARTADVTGVVNNGNLSVNLYNHNQIYTQGFNLVGNPYPSPIDWTAPSGWTRTNIDNALYFFKASSSDPYGGRYSSWVNGISSDDTVSNIIPSMQGFFIHVSNGPPWPVAATLAINNDTRVTGLSQIFAKSGEKKPESLLRLTATLDDNQASSDPLVIYFDEKATRGFDSSHDALKLINTDYYTPSLYSYSSDSKKLSINAIPERNDTTTCIPLGVTASIDGYLKIKLTDAGSILAGWKIYLSDLKAGTEYDLSEGEGYRIFLEAGQCNDRFVLNLTPVATGIPETKPDDIFSVFSSHGIVKSYIDLENTGEGYLKLFNLAGQLLHVERIAETGYNEFNPGLKDGIYIATFETGKYRASRKLYISSRL